MGLDITAVSGLVLEHEWDEKRYEEEDYDWRIISPISKRLIEFTEEGFPGRTEGLKPGFYKSVDCFSFGAGSYSGYNRWREQLSKAILDVDPEIIWNNEEKWVGKPFVELIFFSDCEGLIGPKVSTKLAKDFEDYKEKAMKFAACGPGATFQDGAWFIEKYIQWSKAFSMASDNGYVNFH